MTLIQLIVLLVVLVVVGSAAFWIINKFIAEPIRMPALLIVGVILLLILLSQLQPVFSGALAAYAFRGIGKTYSASGRSRRKKKAQRRGLVQSATVLARDG
jgi:hypothetical protein